MPDGQQFNDTFVTFEGGMNAGVEPYLIPKTELANATNATIRGGFASSRPPNRIVTLNFQNDADIQNAVLNGNFQGSCYYKPDSGLECLMAAISGRLFQFQISGTTATVTEVTIPGDPNPAGISQAWLWQAENYVIWQDGVSIPVFYDGTSSRRSNTTSTVLGTTSVDWVIPPQGQAVPVTLTAPYTGPVPATVFVDNATYQTELTPGGYGINLQNLYDPPGTLHNVGAQVVITPVNLGYLTNNQPVPPGTYATGTLLLTCVMSEPITPGLTGKKVKLNNASQWTIAATSVPFNEIILRNAATFHGGVTFPPGTLVTFVGTVPPNTVVGTIAGAGFVAPPIGNTVPAGLNVPFTGTPGTVVFIGTGQYAITGTPIPPPGVTLSLVNINDTPGVSGTTPFQRGPTPTMPVDALKGPGIIFSMPELPTGCMGAYGLGRNWMAMANRRNFIGSDTVGGPSGTAALQNRDAVLRTTENFFLAGGGLFTVPGSAGSINSMTFSSTLDVSLGQGPLQVGTANNIFSCQAPVDRALWSVLTNPILTVTLIGQGPLSQDSTSISNSDILFRSPLGAGSETLARRDYNTWGNTPISNEVSSIFDADDRTLLGYSTRIDFDNRSLFSVSPTQGPQGVFHKGLVSIQLDAISNLAGKSPSVWEGLWTGLNIFQMREGLFSGVRRGFAFTYNAAATQIELYELLRSVDPIVSDNQVTPIIWSVETPLAFRPAENSPSPPYMRLENGELCVEDVQGRVDFKIQFRPDSDPCWHDWHSWSICAAVPNPLSLNPQPTTLKPQYRKPMGFGQPTNDCDEITGKLFREGFWFQVRLTVQGHCNLVRFRFMASEIPRPKPAPPICGDEDPNNTGTDCPPCRILECVLPDDYNAYSLQNGTLIQNPDLSFPIDVAPGTFLVPAGTIQMVLNDNPTTPLRLLGCQCEIVEDITGQTRDQIVTTAQAMVNEAASQFSACKNQKPVSPFLNDLQLFNCPDGKLLVGLINNPVLPTGITLFEGVLILAPGVISSTISVADANARGLQLLTDTFNNLVAQGKAACGFYNAPQSFTCVGGGVKTIPAFSFFSLISQADADAQALAAAMLQCDFTSNLAAWFKLNDEVPGGPDIVAVDSSGNGNNMTRENTVLWVAGRGGNSALQFFGPPSGGNVFRQEVSDVLTGLPFGSAAWSISLWAQRTTLTPNATNGDWFGFGSTTAAPPGSRANILRLGTTQVQFEDNGGNINYPLPADLNFHNYIAVWPGGAISLSNLQFYVDAVLQVGSGLVDVTPNITGPGPGNREIKMGGIPGFNPTPMTLMDQVILQDCRIYTIALTSGEVSAIFNAPPI